MNLKKILISSLVFTLVLSSIPWQAFAVENSVMAQPVPVELENNTPVILNPIVNSEKIDTFEEPQETKSDFESISDINVSSDTQLVSPDGGPEELLQIPEAPEGGPEQNSLLLTEGSDPYVQRDELKPLSETLNIEEDSVSGAFLYNYPIIVPPGRNGMQPDLVLNYNNQENDNQNLFGYGWDINIPYIQRLNKKGIDKLYTEDYFTSSLTGELSLTNATSSIYNSRVENGQFIEYNYSTSTDAWIAKDKQGTVYTFGSAASSRQDNPSDSTQVYKWMLEEVRDTNDNFVRYTYYKDSGQIYPYQIFYTGYDTTDGIFEVEFLRETRNDTLSNFKTGFEVENNYRIYQIEISTDGQWNKKYHIDYTTGNNGVRSVLDNIVEESRDSVTQQTLSLPATEFDYLDYTENFVSNSTDFSNPCTYNFNGYNHDISLTRYKKPDVVDVNGDSLLDIICYENNEYGDGSLTWIYLNDGDSWEFANFNLPNEIIVSRTPQAINMVEVNGDNMADIVYSFRYWDDDVQITDNRVYINDGGDGWVRDNNYQLPVYIMYELADGQLKDNYARFADVDADGLIDIVHGTYHVENRAVYINKGDGTGWEEDENYTVPMSFHHSNSERGQVILDVNGDGLDDLLCSGGIDSCNFIYINKGDGTGWEYNTATLPIEFPNAYGDQGVSFGDMNGDGLVDILKSFYYSGNTTKEVYINNGTEWTLDNSYDLPIVFSRLYDWGYDENWSTKFIDLDGDGDSDIISDSSWTGTTVYYNNGGVSDLVNNIVTDKGSEIDINYLSSARYNDGKNFSNPDNPLNIKTVQQINIDDGLNNGLVIEYSYADGSFYYDNPYEKRFAGFGKIEKLNGDKRTVSYFHQGNDSNSSEGEYQDSYYKIGRSYRQEVYDEDSTQLNDLLEQKVYKWQEYDQGNSNRFVYNSQETFTDLTGDTKSVVVQKEYDFTNGNLETEYNLGEEIVDFGSGEVLSQISGDEKDTEYLYAQNTTKHILEAPKTKTISDSSDSKQQDLYYDNMPHGQVNKVNLTKEDYIEDDVEINRNFNNYGLVYEQSDPKFATTTISYDSDNLYPESSQDPLGYVTLTEYDPIFGQIASSTNPNGMVTNNTYDPLGRIKKVEISNPDDPSQLLTKQEIVYYDTSLPRYREVKDYFTISNYTASREYYDGLDRVIQKKVQTDNASQWSTIDISYDEQGRVDRQSLPYYTASLSYSSPDMLKPAKTYIYDALGRVLTETTPVGTTTYEYEDFTTIIYDANGSRKDLTKDAYGNLVEVKEYTVLPDFELDVDINTTALWHMNGAAGTEAKKYNEEGTSQYNFTENNFPLDTVGFNGMLNGAYEFNGTNQYVSFVNNQGGALYGDDTTIEAWIYLDQITGQNQSIYNDFDVNPYKLISFYVTGDGKLRAERGDAQKTNTDVTGTTTLPTGEWLYVVAVFENGQPGKVYLNGQLDGTATTSLADPNMSSSLGVNIGAWQYNGGMYFFLDGKIDEMRLSSVARDAQEIGQIYNSYLMTQNKSANGEYYTTTYEYTLTNKLKKITDDQGNIRNFHYDDLDNLDWQDMVHKSAVVNPEKINYTHDKNGNVLTENSFKGDAISYVYDDLNRVQYEKLSGVNQISYTYDQGSYNKGQLTFADYGGNNKKYYNYDVLGRLVNSTTTIENENFAMDFEYNLNGDIEKIVYPNDWELSYNYNSVGQVDSIELDKGAGPVTLVENIEYNANGQMTNFERSNGVDTTYSYDPDQNYRLIDLETTDGVDMLQDLSYTYDDVGNITRIDDHSDTDLAKIVYYDYDNLNRLASSTVNYINHPADNYSRQYQYNAVGNMTYHSELGIMNYNNDNPHQLSGYGTRAFLYDDAGNMSRDGGYHKLAWDHRSRLKSTYDIASEDNTYYKYDHNNQRFLKYTEDYVFVPPDIEERFREVESAINSVTMAAGGGYWEWRRVKVDKYVDGYFEKNTGNHTRTHIKLNNIKIATIKDNGDTYYMLSDHLSSNSIIVDNSGNVLELSDYEPYGNINYETGSSDNKYKFIDKEFDSENSLQYFGARYYDNEIGNFVSVEPVILVLHDSNKLKEISGKKLQYILSDPQSLNSYAYSRNNPIVLVDLDGNWFKELFTGKQSWSDFQVELGQAAQYLYDNNDVAKAAMDHPVAAGAVVGVGGGLTAYGVSAGVTALSVEYLGGAGTTCVAFCSQLDKASNLLRSGQGWSPGRVYDSAKNLVSHFDKHGAKIGAKNINQYYQKANDFIKSGYTNVFKEGADKVYYNVNNNLSAIVDANNNIKTFYRVENLNKISNYLDRISKIK